VKTEEDPSSAACSHNSATSANRVPQTATTTSVANQFIFESVGFCVLQTHSGGDTGTKPSSKHSSTATATTTDLRCTFSWYANCKNLHIAYYISNLVND